MSILKKNSMHPPLCSDELQILFNTALRFGLISFPDLPLYTFSGEIWSWNLVGTNVWPRISGNVRGVQVQSYAFWTARKPIGTTLIVSNMFEMFNLRFSWLPQLSLTRTTIDRCCEASYRTVRQQQTFYPMRPTLASIWLMTEILNLTSSSSWTMDNLCLSQTIFSSRIV